MKRPDTTPIALRISSGWHSKVVRVLLLSRIDDSMHPFEEALFVALVIALPALPVLWVAVPEAGGLLEEMLLFLPMVI